MEWRWRREMGGVGRSRESESEKINGCRRGGSTWLKARRRRGWRASLRVIFNCVKLRAFFFKLYQIYSCICYREPLGRRSQTTLNGPQCRVDLYDHHLTPTIEKQTR